MNLKVVMFSAMLHLKLKKLTNFDFCRKSRLSGVPLFNIKTCKDLTNVGTIKRFSEFHLLTDK